MRLLFVATVLIASTLRADSFDRINTAALQEAFESREPLAGVMMNDAAKAKPLPRTDGWVLAVKTSEGNWSKVLVSWQFRKTADRPLPVLLVDRFATFSKAGNDISLATNTQVMLFAGFAYDLDIGQVVPDGLGGDIEFTNRGEVKPVNGSELQLLDGSKFAEPKTGARPADHDGVLPADYAGEWTLSADGRWSGTLTLNVVEAGEATGEFLSDETKSLYKAKGRVATGQPHRIKLEIEFANATQAFDAYLWTKDKAAMAGTMTMANKTVGFYAVRKED
jgi:hypothetical protein